MKVRVLFFGATADAAGGRETHIELSDNNSDVRTVVDSILESRPALVHHKLLFALNEQYVALDQVIADGDELAIFTAVSGG